MADEQTTSSGTSENTGTSANAKPARKKKKIWASIISTIVIIVVIIVVAMLLTVFFVPEFHTLGDLVAYIKANV
jgi:t-SNARE complex subunit (syntaxin)